MADGLSVAASVAGLIQIADIVIRRGYRYVRDVNDAEKSVENLINEINKLSGVLHSLKNVAERCEDDHTDIEPTAQIHHIEACLKTLQLVDVLLEHSDPAKESSRAGNIKQKLKWPLNRSKVKELMAEVEKHKSVMSLAMTASSMSALLLLLDRQDCIRENLFELKAGMELDRAKRVQVEITEQRRLWLNSLSPVIAQRWQDSNIKLRQPGSGIWFTDGPDFREWLTTKRSKLWVHGIPGAGKTILMASAIQEATKYTDESHALAFFYADYKDTATHDPRNMLGSLARQIAVQSEYCFQTLKDFLGIPGSPGRLDPSGVLSVEVPIELILELAAHFTDVMIIVDGLDEVSVNRSGTADILQSLNRPEGNVKTLFASRKEVDLEYPLGGFKELSIAATSSDLRLYIASEIERRTRNKSLRIQDLELKEHIMRTLVEKADGMFRWVACQLDYLEECTNDRERREALSKLPPDLPRSYERILDRINNSRNKRNQRLVVHALQWILYAKEPLNTSELLEALSIDEGDVYIDPSAVTTEDEVLHWASSLVRRRAGGGLEIAHFTVKEFLVAIDCPHFAPYIMSDENVEVQLARRCLTFLNCRPFSDTVLRTSHDLVTVAESHPFLSYATFNWDCHSLHYLDDEMIWRLTRQLFHPNISNQFDLYRLVRSQMAENGTPFNDQYFRNELKKVDILKFQDSSPLHWAAYLGLGDLCDWLIAEGQSVHQMSCVGTPLGCAIMGHYVIGMICEENLDVRPQLIVYDGHEETNVDPQPSHRGRVDVVQLLLRNGVSVNDSISLILNMVPLTAAIRTIRPDICSVIVAAGARFSKMDLWTIRKFDVYEVESYFHDMCGYVIEKAFEKPDVVLPDALETLFDAAATFVSKDSYFDYDDAILSQAEAVLANLSTHPEALEWGADIDFAFPDVCILYSLLANMHRTLTSPEPFPSRLRKFVVESVKCDDAETISSLLECDVNALSSLTDQGNSMLHIAVEISSELAGPRIKECSEMVKLLVGSGLSVTEQNHQGETPLHLAARDGNLKVCKLLLKADAEEKLLEIRTLAGLTAYDYAVERGYLAMMEFLQHHERLLEMTRDYDKDSKDIKMAEIVDFTAPPSLAESSKRTEPPEDILDLTVVKKLRS